MRRYIMHAKIGYGFLNQLARNGKRGLVAPLNFLPPLVGGRQREG
jgi:hypothetical protein